MPLSPNLERRLTPPAVAYGLQPLHVVHAGHAMHAAPHGSAHAPVDESAAKAGGLLMSSHMIPLAHLGGGAAVAPVPAGSLLPGAPTLLAAQGAYYVPAGHAAALGPPPVASQAPQAPAAAAGPVVGYPFQAMTAPAHPPGGGVVGATAVAVGMHPAVVGAPPGYAARADAGDVAQQAAPGGGRPGSPGLQAGAAPEFARKIYRILGEPAFADIVAWGRQGDTFVVKHANEFARVVLPHYFKHNNWASFVRQLNKYGFHKMKVSLETKRYGPLCWEFRHPHFRYGDFGAMALIRRKVASKGSSGAVLDAAAALAAVASSGSKALPVARGARGGQHLRPHAPSGGSTGAAAKPRTAGTPPGAKTAYGRAPAPLPTSVQQNPAFVMAPAPSASVPQTPSYGHAPAPATTKVPQTPAYQSPSRNLAAGDSLGMLLAMQRQTVQSVQQLTQLVHELRSEVRACVLAVQALAPGPPAGPTGGTFNSNHDEDDDEDDDLDDDLDDDDEDEDGSAGCSSVATGGTGGPSSRAPLPRQHHRDDAVAPAAEPDAAPAGAYNVAIFANTRPSGGGPSQLAMAVLQQGPTHPLFASGTSSPTALSLSDLHSALRLPGPAARPPVNANAGGTVWAQPPRVLLVEDDIVSRLLSSRLLHVFGCSYDVAVDGQAALEKLNMGNQYDLVLMDIVMPKMDGLSATTRIRQFDTRTPIISMTSNVSDTDCVTYFATGMTDILPKPFNRASLLKTLERHCMHLVLATPGAAQRLSPLFSPGLRAAAVAAIAGPSADVSSGDDAARIVEVADSGEDAGDAARPSCSPSTLSLIDSAQLLLGPEYPAPSAKPADVAAAAEAASVARDALSGAADLLGDLCDGSPPAFGDGASAESSPRLGGAAYGDIKRKLVSPIVTAVENPSVSSAAAFKRIRRSV